MHYDLWKLKYRWGGLHGDLLARLRASQLGDLLDGVSIPTETMLDFIPDLMDLDLELPPGADQDEEDAKLLDKIRARVAKQGIWVSKDRMWAVTAARDVHD